jgi:hypothetical protein
MYGYIENEPRLHEKTRLGLSQEANEQNHTLLNEKETGIVLCRVLMGLEEKWEENRHSEN